MPIVYKQHLDERDGTIYNCVLMPDGKWWSAENLRWAGAGVVGIAGRLYSQDEAISSVPVGAHCPTNAEYTALTASLGVPASRHSLPLRATSGWQNNGTDIYGFSLLPGGVSYGGGVISPGRGWGYYWTASPRPGNPSEGYYFVSGQYSYDFASASGADTTLMSVRFIVDVFNEPIPPTKIHGTFSGSGVKVFAAWPSDTTFEVPLSAQSTTELTISKDFITTFGPWIGRVRILVVDGEYISEWKDWDFRI